LIYPAFHQQILNRGIYLSIAKDYFGYGGKGGGVTKAASGVEDTATEKR